MAIEARCDNCGRSFRVKDELSGKRVKCPDCGGAIVVPAPSTAAAADAWYLFTATGEQFGPVPKAELDRWVAQGRVDADCQVLQQGDTDWRWASEVYPELAGSAAPAAPLPAPTAQASTSTASGNYRPLLTRHGNVHGIVTTMLNGECGKSQFGLSIASHAVFQVGELRSWWEQATHGATFGPFPQTKSIHVDYLNTFRIAAPRGEFHLLLPMDGAMPCPVEFACVVPGKLPTSLALVRGAGSNVGVDWETSAGGFFVPRPLLALMKATGGTAQSLWISGAGRTDHPLAKAAEQLPAATEGVRWDGQFKMGNTRVTYRLAWGAQVMPLDEQRFLLVAKNVPQNRMLLGFDVHLDWFVRLRDALGYLVHQNQAPGDGRIQVLDPGNWYAYAVEVMGLRL